MRAFWTGWAIHNCHPCWEAKGSNTALTMPLFYDGLVTPNKEYSVCAVGDSQCQNLSRKTMVNLAAAVATKQTTQTFAKPNPSPCQVDPGTKLALLSCGTMPSWYAMALGLPVGSCVGQVIHTKSKIYCPLSAMYHSNLSQDWCFSGDLHDRNNILATPLPLTNYTHPQVHDI